MYVLACIQYLFALHTHTHIHTHTYARTHARTCTHTHTHTQDEMVVNISNFVKNLTMLNREVQ